MLKLTALRRSLEFSGQQQKRISTKQNLWLLTTWPVDTDDTDDENRKLLLVWLGVPFLFPSLFSFSF